MRTFCVWRVIYIRRGKMSPKIRIQTMNEELLHRYMYGEATEEEKQHILDWFDSDPEKHVAEYQQLQYLYLTAEVYCKPDQQSWGLLKRLGRYAAAAAASVAVMLGMWHLSDRHAYREMSSQVARMETPAGQRVTMQLPDGTMVQLNAGTTLEYPQVFSRGIRRVKLSGEAMFDVSHDTQRPFVVETFASEIEVLGTRFNVLSDEQNARFSTTLVEGRVQVRSRLDPSQVLSMQPNEMVELVGGKLRKTTTQDFQDLCWTEGLIHIKRMPFDELMQRFEKAYSIKITIDRDTLPEIDLQSGKVRISDGIDYAMHVLQQVADFAYSHDEDANEIVIR